MILLDWGDQAKHWDKRGAKSCRICKGATNLRDDDYLPTHKVCLERQMEEAAA
jgi:hypothetical protein